MEKLIELLNEYHHFNSDLIYYGWDEEYERVYFHTELPEEEKEKLRKAGIYNEEDDGIDEDWILDEWICSKKFGFIKWLVENEKIEGEKFQEPKIRGIIGLISNWHNSEGKSYKDYSKELAYESLLMLLSIQDEPIEFLVSILK